jgi:hypothetical protein
LAKAQGFEAPTNAHSKLMSVKNEDNAPEYIVQSMLAFAQNLYVTGQILKLDGGRNV